jgi:hypothetical protein
VLGNGFQQLTFLCFRLSHTNTKSKLIYDRRSVGQSVLMSGSHLEPLTRFLFSVWWLRDSWCGAPSLTIGRVCNLLVQLLLGLARAESLLGRSPTELNDNILLLHLRLPQPGGPGPHIYIPQEQGVQFYPLALGSLLWPFTTRRVTVEVFQHVSPHQPMTGGSNNMSLARIAHKTPLPTVTSLLHVSEPLLSNGCSLAPQVLFWTNMSLF